MHGFVDTRVGGRGRQGNETSGEGEGGREPESDRARGESDHLYLAWVRVDYICIRTTHTLLLLLERKQALGYDEFLFPRTISFWP